MYLLMNKKYFKEEEHLLIGAPLKYLKIFIVGTEGIISVGVLPPVQKNSKVKKAYLLSLVHLIK